MVTIEGEVSRAKRVEFNKPFACIQVRMGQASNVLGEVLEDKKSVVWLDYDGSLEHALAGDLELSVGAMLSGSLILVSVNGMVDQLKGKLAGDTELSPIEYLAQICEADSILAQEKRLTRNDFPKFVSEILHDRLKAAVLSQKPGCEYRPIWTFSYADDANMVTVGGMIAGPGDQERLAESGVDGLKFVSPKDLFDISLPILTEKEKRAMDKLLPSPTAIKVKSLDFELRPKEIQAYQDFYLEYPVFNEMAS